MTFEQLKQKADAQWEELNNNQLPRLYIGTGSGDSASKPDSLRERIESELKEKNITAQILTVGSMGWFDAEPLVGIALQNKPIIWYGNVTPDDVSKLISENLSQGKVKSDLARFCMGDDDIEGIPAFAHVPMFSLQKRNALRNCGQIDPENIQHYIARGGYAGFSKALNMAPEDIIGQIKQAGLKGRGGAGFSTALKWNACANASDKQKYIVCNAAEGDPDAYKDRTILEGDPHAVLEGILIGAFAVGASEGYLYINDTYELAVKRMEIAIGQMRESDLLGKKILDSKFNFNLEIKSVNAGMAAGEESALINTLSGKRTSAYKRPPYPTEKGLNGKPTCINNVETFAHVSAILEKGADVYTETRVYTMGGDVVRKGVFEVPADITLRQIVYDLAGGVQDGKGLKAVRVGGPTGGWLTEENLDITLDNEQLAAAGAIMGSGSIRVANENACAVDLAKQALNYIETETCGKCVFGREGSMQLAEILRDISSGKGRPKDIDLLVELGNAMKEGAFCGLCKSAPNPVLTTITHFRDEYQTHVKLKKCLKGICK